MVDHIQVPVQLGEFEVLHNFVVVESLVTPIILGVDFLHDNGLVLDFTRTPVAVRHPDLPSIAQLDESMEIAIASCVSSCTKDTSKGLHDKSN